MRSASGLDFEVHGDGEPVLLIHGSHIADVFAPLAREPELAARFRRIRYHRRGFAGSARHGGPFGIAEQARDALGLVRELGIDRLHVVGHSYGALTALALALEAPDAVRSLALLEPPVGTADDARATAELLAPLLELYRSGDVRGAVDAFMATVGGPDWSVEIARSLPGAREQAHRDAATFFEVELPALEAWSFDGEKASRIAQPVLYLSGSESGPLFERPRQLFLSCVRHAEEAVVAGCNHLLPVQAPDRVAHSIAEFLARHPL